MVRSAVFCVVFVVLFGGARMPAWMQQGIPHRVVQMVLQYSSVGQVCSIGTVPLQQDVQYSRSMAGFILVRNMVELRKPSRLKI